MLAHHAKLAELVQLMAQGLTWVLEPAQLMAQNCAKYLSQLSLTMQTELSQLSSWLRIK